MGKLINCKDCGKEVSKNAKVCPNCGAKIKRLGMVSKILIAIMGLFVVIMVLGALGGNETSTTSSPSATTPAPASKSAITKENYDIIQKGMTKEQVKVILGEPNSVSETEASGVGKMELHHYQETFSMEAIDITYLDGKVFSKNWTKL